MKKDEFIKKYPFLKSVNETGLLEFMGFIMVGLFEVGTGRGEEGKIHNLISDVKEYLQQLSKEGRKCDA